MTWWTAGRHGVTIKANYIHEVLTKSEYTSCFLAVQCLEYPRKFGITLLWMEPSSCIHKGKMLWCNTCSCSNAQEGDRFTRPQWSQVLRRGSKRGLQQALGGFGMQSRMQLGALEAAQEGCFEWAGVSWSWREIGGHPSSFGGQTGCLVAPEMHPFITHWVTIPFSSALKA